jgi:hypothetical protein
MYKLKWLKRYLCLYWAIILIVLTSCSNQTLSQIQQPNTNSVAQLKIVSVDTTKVVTGQTVYVPIYSYIYHYQSQNHVMNLSATLSIRNTDLSNSIIITAVRYYDTNGQLVRKYLENPVELKSLASTDFFIEADDVTGGLGANFIVEWVAEKAVYEPVIEAVMISTASTQGISFVSPGRVLKRLDMKN